MVRLILDSSSEIATVAIYGDGRILAERELSGMRNHAAILLPAIAECMKESGLAPRDLGEILCCVGPGSFTGVRVGMATALGIAQPHGIPVRGFAYTTLLLAHALEQERERGTSPVPTQYTLAMDAGRGEKYLVYMDLERISAAYSALQKGDLTVRGIYVEQAGLHSKLLFSDALPEEIREQLIFEDAKPIYFRLSQAEEAALAKREKGAAPNAEVESDTAEMCGGGKCHGN